MKNPFVTKGYAGPEYFCDRVKETEDLLKYLGAADLSKDRDRA